MIERVSELPLFGPEEQIRKFFNETIQPNEDGDMDNGNTNKSLLQDRIGNLDSILQKQLIWSLNKNFGEAYFYWDWCPLGSKENNDYWQIQEVTEPIDLKIRDVDRVFDYTKFVGYRNLIDSNDENLVEYDCSCDGHAKRDTDQKVDLNESELMHNIMRSYIEVSEWLGDGATAYGSHNGFVSRKMSFAWLFDAIRALINFKIDNSNRYAEVDIHPLIFDVVDSSESDLIGVTERFLSTGETSSCNVECTEDGSNGTYTDQMDLTQNDGCCAKQLKVRSSNPMVNGILKVRGNEWHYGERAYFYTHNSFIGECRFFHNTRFLGQATFDKEINGTAMRSRWADLAEYKESDKDYEPGTLVMFGGTKEITLSNGVETHAIVTTKPGLVLNGDKQEGKTMVGIALVGTVPVRIVGSVKKFDKLVPSKKVLGAARARKWYEFWKKPIGIAMNASVDELVECVTRLEF